MSPSSMPPGPPPALAAALAVLLAGGAAACSGGGDDDDGGVPDGGPPVEAFIFPRVGHTGYDGANDFLVAVGTTLPGEVAWSVDDAAVATAEAVATPDDYEGLFDHWALVTIHAAGAVVVTATAGERQLASSLTVAAYDPAAVALGAARYNDGEPDGPDERVACASCHLAEDGADHSPLVVAIQTDAALVSAITTGAYPSGQTLDVDFHAWDLTVDEEVGIVAYLRSLRPRGF